MSPLIRGLTVLLWLLPAGFGGYAIAARSWAMGLVFLLLLSLYGAVWIGCRPSGFAVSSQDVAIVFPIWTRRIPLSDVASVRTISPTDIKRDLGWTVRIGVGGLWGGFGWLWTQRQGWVEFYISRLDGFIAIERHTGNTLLITPQRPRQMVATLQTLHPDALARQ